LSLLRDRDRAAAMASRGPETIRNTFCLDAVVARHAEVYERVLAEDRRDYPHASTTSRLFDSRDRQCPANAAATQESRSQAL
jgi:hypothetical protein